MTYAHGLLAFICGFLMAFFGSMPPVGPIAVLLLERGVSGHDREGRGIALGAAFAETAYAALAMAGVSELIRRYPVAEAIARVMGVLVLLVLGGHFLRFRMVRSPAPAPASAGGRGLVGSAALGFTISAANPVLILTWSASIATLLSVAQLRFDMAQRVLFVAGVLSGMLGWFHLFLWMLRRWRDRITLRAAQVSVRVGGATMIALAVWGALLIVRR